ncbi:MAG: MFS transporter [Bacteroidales bacterium]|nr:MFS transporter [Bacteroidales bacterium]MBN2699037.1 MFS transporter [Bacteroidales bacterium]
MMKKPRLSFWQIWNMSFGFLGIQFGFALQNGNVSRIFQTLGAEIERIPILWIAAPVTGLIMQPIIGHLSDKTWGRFGRRRPYFLIGAILASIALIMMPNSPVLWIAVGMLWIMDASINISMEPFRAFVGDMLPNEQRTLGFTMQSFFIGIGAFVASWLPYILSNWFNISNTAPAGQIPDTVKFSFYLGGIVFLAAVAYTVFTTKEYSPEELKAFEETEGGDRKVTYEETTEPKRKYLVRGIIWTIAGILFAVPIYWLKLEQELYILAGGLILFGLLQMFSALLLHCHRAQSGLVSIITDLYRMPKTMGQLAIVQFFSWFALFSMWIYTTAAVTNHLYGTTDTTSEIYNEGANLVSGMFGWYNLFAAGFGLAVLPFLAKITNRKVTHSIALVIGGLGLASIYILKDPQHMIFSMIGVGLAWASILAMPYAILTGSLPSHKMGVYMGIFNFFIVIPQILAATILGFMVRNLFGGDSIYALLTGGASLLIAAVLVLFVHDPAGRKLV